MIDVLELAHSAMREALSLGADEVTAAVSRHTETSLTRRAGKIEQATQATSLELSLTLLVDDRFSVHSTSDLRPDARRAFFERAIAATRALEPEPERRQPPLEMCGHAMTAEQLDVVDPNFDAITIEERRQHIASLEAAVDALPDRGQIISSTAYLGDSRGESARAMSNGFEGRHLYTGFGQGVEVTLEEPGGRRPEAMSWYGHTHRDVLPGPEFIAKEAWDRAARRLGSGPIASGRYPMLLEAPLTGRILGVLGGPLSGSELHQGRSFLSGKKGQQIAASHFTLLDDPLIPRGLGSRSYDGDGIKARPMPIIEDGVLQNYYISVYYGRKLGMAPTTGGRSNWVVPPGSRSVAEILKDLPKCIIVSGFLGGNSNGLTGDFSFGVHGLLVEHGEVTRHLSEMNVSGNIGDIFHRYAEAADDVWTWSSLRTPSLLFSDVQFSGT